MTMVSVHDSIREYLLVPVELKSCFSCGYFLQGSPGGTPVKHGCLAMHQDRDRDPAKCGDWASKLANTSPTYTPPKTFIIDTPEQEEMMFRYCSNLEPLCRENELNIRYPKPHE